MNGNNIYFLGLAIGFALSVAAFIAVLVSPKSNSTHFYLSNTKNLDPKMVKVVNLLGGDLLSLIPKETQKKSISSKAVNDAFKASGNPWGVSKIEFLALRAAYGFIYTIIGFLFVFITQPSFALSIPIILALAYLGWKKPISTYKKIAKTRNSDFKAHFPEMLDYLTMIMSDGTYTFPNAMEVVLPYLPESSVKREFTIVTDSIAAGMDTEGALKSLGQRVPSPALEAFINAINNANKLSTEMDGLMRTQAKKSRADLMNETELVIQNLPSKTLGTVAPAAIISILLIFVVPVVMALLSSI